MFFLITWDWIPSEIYYAYQCKQLPPMQVYKTPEQWVAENQDLIKGDKVEFKIKSEKDIPQISEEGYQRSNSSIDKFFAYVTYDSEKKSIFRNYYVKGSILDRKTGHVIIESKSYHHRIRFYSRPIRVGGKSCTYGLNDREQFIKLENKFRKLDLPFELKEI